MEYPVRLDGVEAVEGGPLNLWAPDKLFVEAEQLLKPNSRVLDVGAGRGTNGTYLAMHGHDVTSLEINPNYAENGRRIIRALGSIAMSNKFIEADMLNLDALPNLMQFDAVFATRSLQEVGKKESYQMVKKIQDITLPGGFNVLRPYIATTEQQAAMPRNALFEPNELQGIYKKAGWTEVKYQYMLLPLNIEDDRTYCQSTAELIAKKPNKNEVAKQELLRQANYYKNSDVEYYNVLMEQIETM